MSKGILSKGIVKASFNNYEDENGIIYHVGRMITHCLKVISIFEGKDKIIISLYNLDNESYMHEMFENEIY